jgi:hypothetical protein
MLLLVMAAWPKEIRPAELDDVSVGSYDVLTSAGISAGLAVFTGDKKTTGSILSSECIVIDGIDSEGHVSRLHPQEPCPREGYRWKPEIFDQMIFHWAKKIRPRSNPANLVAMADYFCNSSLDEDLLYVEIVRVIGAMDYETGRESTTSRLISRSACRWRLPPGVRERIE